MTRPSDAHFDAFDERGYGPARDALTAVQRTGVDHVVAGGWAVYAHVPRVPSVDVDLFLGREARQTVRSALASAGISVGEGQEVELLDLEGDIEVWGFGDPDLGERVPGYHPLDLFQDRVERRPLDLPDGTLSVPVPTRPALAVTKLVALRNRDLAYRAHRSGEAGMLLGPTLAARVRSRAPSYYLRKCGKDLFDLSLVLGDARAAGETARLLEDVALAPFTGRILDEVHEDTVACAEDFADRTGTGAPVTVVRNSLTDATMG